MDPDPGSAKFWQIRIRIQSGKNDGSGSETLVKSGKYLLKSDHLGPFLFVKILIYGTYLENTNFKRLISKEKA